MIAIAMRGEVEDDFEVLPVFVAMLSQYNASGSHSSLMAEDL
jgi:hypothetical protein